MQTTRTAKADQPTLSLPTARLLASVAIAAAVVAGGWYAIATFGPWDAATARTGLFGAILTGCIALLGVLVMTPWVARPIIDWTTMWLAGTVVRLIATPAAAWLLYSASPGRGGLAAEPLALSVALTYLATLFSEAIVLSLFMKRST